MGETAKVLAGEGEGGRDVRIAALYDIHGNLPALDAVLSDLEDRSIDRIVVGGDIVSGPMPGPALDRLLASRWPVTFVCGNGDRDAVAAFDGLPAPQGVPPSQAAEMAWLRTKLDRRQREALAAMPATASVAVEGLGDVLFCHATPRSDTELFTPATPPERLAALFAPYEGQLVVCGHTHIQFDLAAGKTRVVNAGSVGMPYADAPGAYWLLVSSAGIAHQRTDYDLEAAAAAVRASGYPNAEQFATENLLHVPTASEAIAVFEAWARE